MAYDNHEYNAPKLQLARHLSYYSPQGNLTTEIRLVSPATARRTQAASQLVRGGPRCKTVASSPTLLLLRRRGTPSVWRSKDSPKQRLRAAMKIMSLAIVGSRACCGLPQIRAARGPASHLQQLMSMKMPTGCSSELLQKMNAQRPSSQSGHSIPAARKIGVIVDRG